ncbi:MAG: NusG domain II-containing protein [Lachnospiraceae bacterium]|nr:NusG domain II-containing protein [Lachnospiraceae bacterium]
MNKLPSHKKNAMILSALIALLLLVCLGSIAIIAARTKKQALVAEVYQNGTLIKTIPLYLVTENQTFTVTGENGAENVIEVRPGSIAVISASCPDKICVHQGFRSDSLLPITCLPNHLVIKLRLAKDSDASGIDALTY